MNSSSGGSSGNDWRSKCRQLLEIIWNNTDSEPFREPVDTLEHRDYLEVIGTPMDLLTIREDLAGGNYDSQAQFLKDMRRIFSNSRAYNTNPRSKVRYLDVLFRSKLVWLMKCHVFEQKQK